MSYDKAAALRIKSWLRNHGLTQNGAYGLMANIYCESGFRANNLQNSFVKKLNLSDEQYTAAVDSGEYTNFVRDSAGYGLCQWTFWSRKQALLDYRNSVGRSIGDETMQLEYLLVELTKKYPTVLNLLKSSDDERECAIRVMLDFERPANKTEDNQQKRADYATQLKNDLGDEGKMIKIALDAGHGYNTAGRRCINAEQTREWWLNDRIADKLQVRLKAYQCEVLRTDDTTGVTDVDKPDRVNASNSWGADIFISIHHNAGAKSTTAGGTVVYHCCTSERGIGMAQALYDEVVAQTGLVGNRSSHVVKSDLYVVKYTDTYAYLIENGFMDSISDVDIIVTDEHAEKTVRGIINFLVNHFGLIKIGNEQDTAVKVQPPVIEEKPVEEPKEEEVIIPEPEPEPEVITPVEPPVVEEPKEEEVVAKPTIKPPLKGNSGNKFVPIAAGLKYFPKIKAGITTDFNKALASFGFAADFSFKQRIAEANGIKNYKGNALQDGLMLKYMKQGRLIMPEGVIKKIKE